MVEQINKVDRLFTELAELISESQVTDNIDGDPDDKDKFWSNGEEICSRDGNAINALADLFDQLYGENTCITGQYDVEEDKRNGEVDEYTGCYYLKIS